MAENSSIFEPLIGCFLFIFMLLNIVFHWWFLLPWYWNIAFDWFKILNAEKCFGFGLYKFGFLSFATEMNLKARFSLIRFFRVFCHFHNISEIQIRILKAHFIHDFEILVESEHWSGEHWFQTDSNISLRLKKSGWGVYNNNLHQNTSAISALREQNALKT